MKVARGQADAPALRSALSEDGLFVWDALSAAQQATLLAWIGTPRFGRARRQRFDAVRRTCDLYVGPGSRSNLTPGFGEDLVIGIIAAVLDR